MSIYPILAWFNGSWHGSTVQFTAFFLFEKKKKKSRKSWIFNPGDINHKCAENSTIIRKAQKIFFLI
jgi:hypothetical protein